MEKDYSKWFFENMSDGNILNNYILDVLTLWFKDKDFLENTIDVVDTNATFNNQEIKELVSVIKEFVKEYGYKLDPYYITNTLNRKYSYFKSEELHSELIETILNNNLSEERELYIKRNFPHFNIWLAIAKGRNLCDELLINGSCSSEQFFKKIEGICSHFNNIQRSINYRNNVSNEW